MKQKIIKIEGYGEEALIRGMWLAFDNVGVRIETQIPWEVAENYIKNQGRKVNTTDFREISRKYLKNRRWKGSNRNFKSAIASIVNARTGEAYDTEIEVFLSDSQDGTTSIGYARVTF